VYGIKPKHNIPHRFSRRRIRTASGTVNGIKLKLSACFEGNVEENKDEMRILPILLVQLLLLQKLIVLR
jgi:hypothetical protein